MMKKNILFIVVMWSLLAFVSYNVLTVEAAETLKDACKKMDGKWKDSECKFEDGVEMGQKYSKEQYQVDFEHYISDKGLADAYYEEIAAKEDAICDNEDADTTNVELCMSEDRKNNNEEREWYYDEDRQQYEYLTEEEQIEHNMESETGIRYGDRWGPEDGKEIIPPKEPYPTTEIEDWGNTVSETDEEKVINQISSGDPDNRVETPVEQRYSPEEDTSSEEATEDEEEESEEEEEEESNEDDSNEEES